MKTTRIILLTAALVATSCGDSWNPVAPQVPDPTEQQDATQSRALETIDEPCPPPGLSEI